MNKGLNRQSAGFLFPIFLGLKIEDSQEKLLEESSSTRKPYTLESHCNLAASFESLFEVSQD